MGSQRTISKYNLEYFHEDLVAGDYDMPTIYPTVYEPKQLIGFNYLNTVQSDAGIHFYLDDYQFERFWKKPKLYIEKLQRFDCVLSPDFSLYRDMPLAMMMWNVYRSRLLGQMMQQAGITVIPTVSWAGQRSFDFCFDGLPQYSTLSISTIGVKRNKVATSIWQIGVKEMLKRLHPRQLLIYGGKIEFDYPTNVDVVYYDNDNVKRLRKVAANGEQRSVIRDS
ncbi:DUF4417 domain-containing protein [Limosilactobacillus coleohominis]|uniref:DUF4417 domain-containing protein n=1 Tax=Limosilactobacillus coleohominis TaxID=181675 RepID=UPI0026E9B40E|nr:DUF4417 domain-containing protein [Limosilactobacillus coleohominis]